MAMIDTTHRPLPARSSWEGATAPADGESSYRDGVSYPSRQSGRFLADRQRGGEERAVAVGQREPEPRLARVELTVDQPGIDRRSNTVLATATSLGRVLPRRHRVHIRHRSAARVAMVRAGA
jgi:hypothetical protein